MRIISLLVFLHIAYFIHAQNTFNALLLDDSNGEPLIGASAQVVGTKSGAVSGVDGKLSIAGIPDGTFQIRFSYVGYETLKKSYSFPLSEEEIKTIRLIPGQELETVEVMATRSSRSIENIPTRIETITSEELGEKAVMNSSNISMLLRESSGIMMQQTSANSGNQSLRIQGLDGRYTQLLKDGFPLFSGFAGGLSIMQVPPLDLRQVEVIKGSASTLYGGGAIAGLVNLVSKRPVEDRPELSFMINQTSAGGTTANTFWSQRFDKTGLTLYATANRQEPYDPNEDNFSDIPKVRSLSLNPRFFWYPDDQTTFWIGLNAGIEDRVGGDLNVIDGETDSIHTFSEQNQSNRVSSQAHFERHLGSGQVLTIRNSISFFDRSIEVPDYLFQGQQLASFSEVTWTRESANADWILGANLFTDRFKDQSDTSSVGNRDYSYVTQGVFAQNNWNISKQLILESGFRLDHNQKFGVFPLPRLSLLFKSSKKFSYRLGGGMGYKLPTIFNEASEVEAFQGVEPIAINSINPEHSVGANFDVNFQTAIGDHMTFSWNQLFFYTQLTNSLVLQPEPSGTTSSFINADGPVESKGFESNIKYTVYDFKLFLQYVYTDVTLDYLNTNKQKPLTPKHNFGATLMYETEHKWRVGYELYYIGEQYRSDYSETRDYWMMGFMALREFKKISVFLNFENFTDTRQSRFQPMFTPPDTNPTNTEIWAPTDGFVINGGFILKLISEK